MNPLLAFGGILFIILAVVKGQLKWTVTNKDCPEDVNDVKNNKSYFKIFSIIDAILLSGGAIWQIIDLLK